MAPVDSKIAHCCIMPWAFGLDLSNLRPQPAKITTNKKIPHGILHGQSPNVVPDFQGVYPLWLVRELEIDGKIFPIHPNSLIHGALVDVGSLQLQKEGIVCNGS